MTELYHKTNLMSIVGFLLLFLAVNAQATGYYLDGPDGLRERINRTLEELEIKIVSLTDAYEKAKQNKKLMNAMGRLLEDSKLQYERLKEFNNQINREDVTEAEIITSLKELFNNNIKIMQDIQDAYNIANNLTWLATGEADANLRILMEELNAGRGDLIRRNKNIKSLIEGRLLGTVTEEPSTVVPPAIPDFSERTPPSPTETITAPNTSALRLIVIRAGLELKNEYPNIRIKNTDIEVSYWREAKVLRIILEVDYDGDGPQEKKLITIDLPVGEQLTVEYILRYIKNTLNSEGWRPAATDYNRADLISATDFGIERNRTEMENWTAFLEYLPTVEARRGSLENLRFKILELLADLAYKDMLMKDLKGKLGGSITKEEISRLLTDINKKNIDIINDLYSKDSIYTWLYVPATRTFNDPKLREQLQFLREMRKATIERYRYTKDMLD